MRNSIVGYITLSMKLLYYRSKQVHDEQHFGVNFVDGTEILTTIRLFEYCIYIWREYIYIYIYRNTFRKLSNEARTTEIVDQENEANRDKVEFFIKITPEDVSYCESTITVMKITTLSNYPCFTLKRT